MSSSTHFRVVPGITHQLIEGEVIVLNLDTGAYYSLDGSAAAIWEAAQRQSLDGIVQTLQAQYESDIALMEAETRRLLDELCTESLLMPLENGSLNGTTDTSTAESDATNTPLAKTPFVVPVLNKYTDMTDLLLLDPIHEVDETGWPHAADPTVPVQHPA